MALGFPELINIGMDRSRMNKAGMLYTGEMGTALSRKLMDAGFKVLSCVSGRSERTRTNAMSHGITLMENIEEVIEESRWIFCLVPPHHSVDVAERVSGAMCRTGKHPVYVDCNSVGPRTMRTIASVNQS